VGVPESSSPVIGFGTAWWSTRPDDINGYPFRTAASGGAYEDSQKTFTNPTDFTTLAGAGALDVVGGDIVDGANAVYTAGDDISLSGSAAHSITFKNFTFTSWTPEELYAEAYAIRLAAESYVRLENITINTHNEAGVVSNFAGIVVTNCTNIDIVNCTITNLTRTSGNGFGIYLKAASSVDSSNITISGCSFGGNETDDIRAALAGTVGAGDTSAFVDLSVSNCTSIGGTTGSFFRFYNGSAEFNARESTRVSLIGNTVTNGGNFVLSLQAVIDAVVRDNNVTNCGSSSTNNCIQMSYLTDPIIENNVVDGVGGVGGGGDGAGIILDYVENDTLYLTTGAIVRNNTVRGALKAGSKAPGISCWRAQNSIISGNLIENCITGIIISNSNSTGNVVYNNTVLATTGRAALLDNSAAASAFKNNVLQTTAEYAVVVEGGSTLPTLTNNSYYGYTGAAPINNAATETAADATSIIINPHISGDGKTEFSSPAYRAGVNIVGFHDTYNHSNDSWGDIPSIGLDDNGYSRRRYIRRKYKL
jgi:hypothetical protein